MGSKQQAPLIHVGASSLLVVFLVLCLVIFAALSLTGAQNDASYSHRVAQRRTAFYTACNQAEQLLDEIDARLEAEGPEADLSGLGVTLGDGCLNFSVPLNDTQAISVALELTPGGVHYYEIRSYRIVTTAEQGDTDPLPLMTIGDEEHGT